MRCVLPVLISIHALLAESDDTSGATVRIFRAFLSTLSLRRATNKISAIRITREHFYPRSPCGERPKAKQGGTKQCLFLSTLSLRRATALVLPYSTSWEISIHALLAESDKRQCRRQQMPPGFLSTLSLRRATPLTLIIALTPPDFYPRSPCGERLATT